MNTLSPARPAVDPAANSKATALLAVARIVADRLSRGIPLSRQVLSNLMREHVGGTDANGDWSLRDAYDALETGQVLLALDPASPVTQWDAPDAAFQARDFVARMLHTQSYRSERQVDLQQFSTPLGLAWFVACASQIRSTDLVLEPSAGTGMLAVDARHRGAELILNERDPAPDAPDSTRHSTTRCPSKGCRSIRRIPTPFTYCSVNPFRSFDT